MPVMLVATHRTRLKHSRSAQSAPVEQLNQLEVGMNQLAPIPNRFTSVIATRSFDLIEDGMSSKLVIEIGRPVQDVETVTGLDWRCPVRFIKGTTIQERRACGADAVQALQLALQLVHNEVERLSEEKSHQILLFGHSYDRII